MLKKYSNLTVEERFDLLVKGLKEKGCVCNAHLSPIGDVTLEMGIGWSKRMSQYDKEIRLLKRLGFNPDHVMCGEGGSNGGRDIKINGGVTTFVERMHNFAEQLRKETEN